MSLPHAHNEPDGPKHVLRFYGFAQPWRVRFWPLLLVVIVVVIYLGALLAVELADVLGQSASTAGAAGAAATAKGPPKATTIATAVLALGAFVVGYHQWRAARRETSMERFYDRLDIANRRLAALEGVDPFHMYVFAELDNLEYVIEKYRLGYMSPAQALRGLRAFQSRLKGYKGADFEEYALKALHQSAYSPATCDVVRQVIAKTVKSEGTGGNAT